MRSGLPLSSSASSSRNDASVRTFPVLTYRNFRFGEAPYFPDAPTRSPWRTPFAHFRLVLSSDFPQRHLDEPANLPRPWGQLFWIPEQLAHAIVSRLPGQHFWIVPRVPPLVAPRLPADRITAIKDHWCIDIAVRIYDEYQRGDEALSMDLDANGHLLIGLVHRVTARTMSRTR